MTNLARSACWSRDDSGTVMSYAWYFHVSGKSSIGKTGPDQENSRKYLPFGEKIVKIGPVDTEIALLIVKKIKKKRN